MTAQSRTNLQARFENGDTPQGTDYTDLIDSFVSLVDTTAQTLSSNLIVPTLIATEVSAQTLSVQTFTTDFVVASAATFTRVDATTVSGATVNGATMNATNIGATAVSAANFNVVSSLTLGVATTVAASAGGGGAVPVSADGFITVTIGADIRYIPYFKVK